MQKGGSKGAPCAVVYVRGDKAIASRTICMRRRYYCSSANHWRQDSIWNHRLWTRFLAVATGPVEDNYNCSWDWFLALQLGLRLSTVAPPTRVTARAAIEALDI